MRIRSVLASETLGLHYELVRIRNTMAPTGRSASTSASITHWHNFHEEILLDCVSACGIWLSKTGPQQMESAASKWGNVPYQRRDNSDEYVGDTSPSFREICHQLIDVDIPSSQRGA
jgi:hypothetical protein